MNWDPISLQTSANWGAFPWVILGLVLFGIIFNALIHLIGESGDVFTFVYVVIGVLVTVIGLAVVAGPFTAVLALALFAASGTPMCIGAMFRVIHRKRTIRREAERVVWAANREG